MPKSNRTTRWVVTLVGISLVACSANESNEPAGNLATPTPGASVASAAPTNTPASSQPGPPASYVVGDRIKLGEEEYFGVVEVDLAVPGNDFIQPDPGNKWIAALVEIEGINPDGATYNPFFFKVRDNEGFEYHASAFGKEPALQSSNDLQPGTKIKGWVTFEVPESATTFALVYAPGFFSEPVEVALN